MTVLRLFRIYLVIYFLFPVVALYFSLISGTKVPVYLEVFPLILLVLSWRGLSRVTPADFLFAIPLVGSIVFLTINLTSFSWINNFETRAPLLMAINYVIFRNLIKSKWSYPIADTVVLILKYSMYLLVVEFLIININGIGDAIESRYLMVYPDGYRLYENLVSFKRPIGLYPGPHNAAVASVISLAYLVATKSIRSNKWYFAASLLVFIICFGLTSVITAIVISMVMIFRKRISAFGLVKTVAYFIVGGVIVYLLLIYNLEITQIRSHGEITEGRYVEFEDYVYIKSLADGLESLIDFPFGRPVSEVDLFQNEVYISRMIMFYGGQIVVFYIAAFIVMVVYLKRQSKEGVFFSISYLALFSSSFHYPSMAYYPLNILVPLAFVLIRYRSNRGGRHDLNTSSTLIRAQY